MMALGKVNGNDVNEKFSMSFLAANLSQNVNGVSMLHGDVSKEIFSSIYPGYQPEELFISYVTNGVHYPTWAAAEWKKIHARVFGPEFATHHYDKSCFEGIYKVSDSEIWGDQKDSQEEADRHREGAYLRSDTVQPLFSKPDCGDQGERFVTMF